MKMLFYAHTRGTDPKDWQTVQDHLKNTASIARRIGADTGLAEFAAAAAMLHDIGKYSQAFQRRLAGGAKVDHATAGAKEAERFYSERGQAAFGRLLAYCIAGHHGGLPDAGSPIDTADEPTLAGRLKRPVEDYSDFSSEFDPGALEIPAHLPTHFRPIRNAPGFSISFIARMIYSILVDADFLETETFCNGGKKARGEYAPTVQLAAQFARYLRRFQNPERVIDQRRNAMLEACVAQAALPPGLFTLTLPTGAGKTIISMAFAMRHAILHGMKRIVYVIPYTSIIEQNAAVFKRSLEGYEDHVLEHHSSFDWTINRGDDASSQPDSALTKLRWAAENWDVPIVVTTNVQFFESLFANRSARSRKVHNLARSVIIFDEAQMLPRAFMQPSITSVVELVKNYGASAVFCTATQPAIEKFLPPGENVRELVPDPKAEYAFYRRVQVTNAGTMTDEALVAQLALLPQVLCIVNTRKHARALFERLPEEGRFHLSTLMCAVHRRAVIAEIRERLASGQPCRVISTQLLEAGVDLDFPTGYRAMAGLESIIQAAGRVNREGRRSHANLIIFEPDSEYAKQVPTYIKQTAAVTDLILKKFEDPVCLEAIQDYFDQLYGISAKNAFDQSDILACFEKSGSMPAFDFAKAAERFKLIDNGTRPVIIPYDDTARTLLQELQTTFTPFQTIRKLQSYTVNIFQPEFQALENAGAILPYADTYAVLNQTYGRYDPHTGLTLASMEGGQAVFLDA